MKTCIVIPTYNEAENIIPLLRSIGDLQIPQLSVVVVDDNSPDGTAALVAEYAVEHPIFLIQRRAKLGIGSAYIEGFTYALSQGAELIFEMDADFSHDPNDIPRMIASAQQGADLVIGSRKIQGGGVEGWGAVRMFMSNGAMHFSRLLLGLQAKDVTAGFRCFKKEVLRSLDLSSINSNGYAFQEELLYLTQTKGFVIQEIPVIFSDRTKGKSKLSKKDIMEFFVVMVKLRFRR